MTESYTVKDIQVLEGLDAVRKRPGMYIGSTGYRGLHHMLWEIIDNSIDEAANGFADTIDIILYPDGSVSVEDNGRGIPVGIHPELKVSGVEVVYTQLHAGGKFNNASYAYSGGLHGVGASVVNALSKWLKVEVYRDGQIYFQEYRSIEENGKLHAGKPVAPLAVIGTTQKRGTKVTYLPDEDVFDGLDVHFDKVARRLKELAFLIKGLTIHLTDKRGDKDKKVTFSYSGGLSDFLVDMNKEKTPLHPLPILLEGSKNGVQVMIAMQYVEGESENIYSYVNNIPTPEGGTHETGFKTALTRVMNDYIKNTAFAAKEKISFEGEDYREGLTAILSLKMANVQFEGQTKTRLGNTEARTAVDGVVYEELSQYFADLNNAALCTRIAEKALTAAKARIAAKKAKKIEREKSKADSAPLVGKLSSCTGRKAEDNELFIVEGDSAGGNAKMGRDRRFQAILPLRGKPLNVEKKRIEQVLQNDEFRSIITALGAGFDKSFDVKNLKYHKVIILSDADQDGAHIRTILLTFFFRYFKDLLKNGHVFIAQPPLYSIKKGRKTLWAHTDKQLEQAKKELGRGAEVKRYKGLGEMSKEQLWETTLDPAARVLVQVTLEDAAAEESIVSTLMGDAVEPRKQYIGQYANFNKKDNFKGAVQ
ncbi:DNA gyrase subunit B [Christensenellaceae bacterium NSJ-63]|uniref:DNA topoisomerase (ATP-hydrolyzing) n=1 Tax=Guopingia tenuis TaxID=2763656 RepID=A0A926HW78_9FIRM|nr:DNA gyrase subunit B [Guopingia tenuis]MBC8538068.1 DNA gyrase subunit B [Guopingia tenuis]